MDSKMRRNTVNEAMWILMLPLLLWAILSSHLAYAEEDGIVKAAIETFRSHVRLPSGTEIKFVEKKESPAPGFFAVKLLIDLPDREVPAIVYVHKDGEKVFVGNLFVKGENVTVKEAGPPKPKKIDMASLEIDRSPFKGSKSAKVTIVEFSNFQCPHCKDSWNKLKTLLEKRPNEIRYIFKHFPFQPSGKTFELSEMAASAHEAGQEAFWLVHDFLFTNEGQNLARLDRKAIQLKLEQLLKGKGYNVKAFRDALENGSGKQKVLDDMAMGKKLRITGTPTKVVNGDLYVGVMPDEALERYLGK